MKIHKREVVQKSPFLEFVKTNYANTKNKLATWYWCRRPNSRKAVVIACMVDDKLVVIKEFRVPVENYEIGFPAGLIDYGETPEGAVRRELEEETGLKVEEILHISPAVLSSAGLTDEAVHLAFVRASGIPNKDKLEESEDIDTSLLTRNEVEALMKDSKYPFGKTAYSVMRTFVKYGEIW